MRNVFWNFRYVFLLLLVVSLASCVPNYSDKKARAFGGKCKDTIIFIRDDKKQKSFSLE